MSKVAYLNIEMLKNFISDVFVALKVPEKDAKIVSDVLITSDLRGITSHGVQRLKYYYDRLVSDQTLPVTNLEIIRETPTTAVIDGHLGMGHVIAHEAMKIAIKKAKEYGMGAVAVRNSTHFGIAGYYSIMAVEKGCMGMTVTNARPAIAPTFSVEPMLGTNPIAIGFPSDDFPFILDFSTAIAQRGKIEVYSREDKEIPEGWVISEMGEPLNNAKEILQALVDKTAALLALGGVGEELGGHKGYGLATFVEIASAAFCQGDFLKMLAGFDREGNRVPYNLGHFFLAIDVEAFCPLEDFKKTTGEICRALRGAKLAPGQERIYTAGEKEFESSKKVLMEGVPVNKDLQRDLIFLRNELNLNRYKFDFEK
jgi:LDH2 family malate/lactate/ureidoglycolate dehydrogenase